MAFWNRKPKKVDPKPTSEMIYAPDLKSPKCSHKFRDFHWYVEGTAYAHHFSMKLIEPYVCVWCGERKNVVLQEFYQEQISNPRQEMVSITKSLIDTYGDRIQPRAMVEDEIHDMQLVDRDYLRALALVHPEKLNGMDEQAKVALQKS